MTTIIFSTNNQNKVDEIKHVLGNRFSIISLKDAGIDIDIPEPHDNFKDNASEKSQTIYRLTGKNCFSEDTGLEVDALGGEPGVKSARYSGDDRDFNKNIDLLLQNLLPFGNRAARFKTVISLILGGEEYFFEGICNGLISHNKNGENGFGYDAVFVPDGSLKSFAQMDLTEKNKFSHRKKAVEKMVEFLNNR